MFQVFMVLMNVVFSVMSGVVFVAATGFEWWFLTFVVGVVLWNVVVGAIVLFAGFVFGNRFEGGN